MLNSVYGLNLSEEEEGEHAEGGEEHAESENNSWVEMDILADRNNSYFATFFSSRFSSEFFSFKFIFGD